MAHKKISPAKRDQVNDWPEGKSRIQQKEKCMYFLSWIFVGLVAGWSAGKIIKGNGYGALMDVAVGIGGAWRADSSCAPQAFPAIGERFTQP